MAVLKTLTKIAVVLYLSIYYGQELLEKGGDPRKYFYFIGMSIFVSLISYILYRVDKNIATQFLLFVIIGEVFNNIFCSGEFKKIEMVLALIGLLYVLFEDEFKKSWEFIKKRVETVYLSLEKSIKKWRK